MNQATFASKMTLCRILRLFVGTRLAARAFGFRPHWVRDAKQTGYSII